MFCLDLFVQVNFEKKQEETQVFCKEDFLEILENAEEISRSGFLFL